MKHTIFSSEAWVNYQACFAETLRLSRALTGASSGPDRGTDSFWHVYFHGTGSLGLLFTCPAEQ